MPDLRREVLALVAEAYENRLAPRLEGLTDEEYVWEPAPDCWTIHANGDGTFRGDWGYIFDEIPPFTTIAWRMSHLIDCYGSSLDAKDEVYDATPLGWAEYFGRSDVAELLRS